jgi:hypothetical protein
MSSKEKQQVEKIEIEKTIIIDASPQVVFKAILEAKVAMMVVHAHKENQQG